MEANAVVDLAEAAAISVEAATATADPAPETPDPQFEDAYARHFHAVLTAVLVEREDHRALFATDELAIAERFLRDVPPREQQLYARLFQRRGPWFKTTSLFRYFTKFQQYSEQQAGQSVGDKPHDENAGNGELDHDDNENGKLKENLELPTNRTVQASLDVLVETGFLRTMAGRQQSSGSIDEDEMLRESLQAIEQCATAGELALLHRKLMGSNSKKRSLLSNSTASSSTPAPLTGKAFLLESIKREVMTQRRIDGSRIPVGRVMQQIWVDSYPLADRATTDHMVVRFAEAERDVLLRMHRLFYFQAAAPFAYSMASPPASSDVKSLLDLAVAKMRREPTQWPGLLVFFKKIQYPSYPILTRHRAFQSPELYVCYEMARQLHHLMRFIDQFMEIVIPEEPEPDLDIKWMLHSSQQPFAAFQRLASLTGVSNVDDDDDDSVVILDDLPSADSAAQSWQLRSWEQFYQELARISTLDDFVLTAKSSLRAYASWSEHVRSYEALSTDSTASEAPVQLSFFVKCNAAHHLARVLHTAVSLYEKLRKYQVAILLLNDLLATPFLKRKRGHWWERLALNLEHLKCFEQAQQTCANALNDPFVFDADRITIERRYARLQKRFASTQADIAIEAVEDEQPAVHDTPTSVNYDYRQNYIVGRPLNRSMGEKSRFIGYDDEPCGVEQLVLQYYRAVHTASENSASSESTGGWYGVHCEGTVLGNLFGIFMWDVLYAGVPDVFQTPFQVGPLDFGHADEFYVARCELIEDRLVKLEHGMSNAELLEDFCATWAREFGKLSRFVHWPRGEHDISLRFHLLVVIAMDRKSLVKLLRYMTTSEEFHRAQNGLPDLLMVRVEPLSGYADLVGCPVDETNHLDVYDYCRMDYQVNMNGDETKRIPAEDEALKSEDKDRGAETACQWESMLPFADAGAWRVELKLVEVKGPRDRLSDKQLLWLKVLSEDFGLDASVMHVAEEQKHIDKKQNKNARSKTRKPTPSSGNQATKRRKS